MAYNAASEGDLDRVFITNAELVEQYIGEKLYTWGYNGYGQLGNNSSGTNFSSPVTVAGGGSTWTQVVLSPQSSSAIKTDGTLWTCGYNAGGVLGVGDTTGRSSLTSIAGGGTNWKQVSMSYAYSAAIKTDGTLWTWGNNPNGQLGTGNTSSYSSPVTTVAGGNNWKQVSINGCNGTSTAGTTAAIKTDGTLWTWGFQGQGLLGDWTVPASRTSPAVVVGPPALSDASVNKQNITLTSTTTPVVTSNVKKFDTKTLYFSGSGTGYLTVPVTQNSVPYGTEDFTIEAWVYPLAVGFGIYSAGTGTSAGINLRVHGDNTLRSHNDVNGGNTIYIGATTAGVALGKWSHVAICRSSGVFKMFVNGILSLTNSSYTTSPLTYPISSNSVIGYDTSSATTSNGYIDQLCVTKGIAKYSASFVPSLHPLYDPVSSDAYYSNVCLLLKADDVANGKDNNTFINSSETNLTITRNGNATQGSVSPFAAETSKWSNYFDGNADYLSIPSNAALQLPTQDFTIEAFFNISKWPGTGSSYTIVHKGSNTLSSFEYNVVILSTGIYNVIRVSYSTNGTAVTTIDSSYIPLTTNAWHHVAVTRVGTTVKFWFDGVSAGSSTSFPATVNTGTGQVTIGSNYYGSSSTMLGYISNVRIVKGTALYTAAFTPSTVPLTAIAGTSLLACQDNTFVDNSTNNFTLTANGDVKALPFSPFSKSTDILATWFNGAATFNYLSVASNAALQLPTQDFTIESWVNLTTLPTTGTLSTIVQKGYSAGTNAEYRFGINNNTGTYQLYFDTATAGTFSLSATSNNIPSSSLLGIWNHIAITRVGTTVTFWFNGVNVGTGTIPATLYSGAAALTIGANTTGGSGNLAGYLSDVRVVKGTAVYTSNFTPSMKPLKAITNTSLLTCQSDIVDNSSNRFTITKNGDVYVMPVVSYESSNGNSVYFTATGDYLTVASNANLQLPTQDFTIEAFINLTALPGSANSSIIVSKGYDGGSNSEYRLAIYNNGSTYYLICIGSTTGTFGSNILSSAIPSSTLLNTWNHVAFTRVGTTVNLWFNGVNVGTSSSFPATLYTGSGAVSIGANEVGGFNLSLTGWISNVRIVKGTALYTSTFTPPKLDLSPVANTVLLTCQDKSLKDNSSNNFTVTGAGNAKPVQVGPFKQSDYYYGGSMYFDGAGDYVVVTSPGSSFTPGTNDFTIEAWIYTTADTLGNIFSQRDNSGISIRRQVGGALDFFYSSGVGQFTSASAIPLNSWNHVAFTRSSSTAKIWINGVLSASNSDANWGSSIPGGNITVGSWPTLSEAFAGYISNLRFVNGAALYTSNFTPSFKPLSGVANTSLLLSGTNGGIVDSACRYNVETSGNVQISTNYRKWNTGSMYFDGTGDYITIPSSPDFTFTGDYEIEAWVYLTNAAGGEIVSKHVNGVTGWYSLAATSSGATFTVWDSTNISAVAKSSNAIPLNTWVHISGGVDAGKAFVTLNGVSSSTALSIVPRTTDAIVTIGINCNKSSNAFTGYIDDVRITKDVVRYDKNFSVTTKPLAKFDTGAAKTLLLTCQSPTLVDNSTNALTVTANAQAAVSTFAPFVGSYSVYFDGGGDRLTINNVGYLTGDFTVEGWFYATNALLDGRSLFSVGSTTLGDSYSLYLEERANAGTLALFVGNSTNTWLANAYTGSNKDFATNSWTHIAVTRSGTTLYLFSNGRLLFSLDNIVGTIGTGPNVFIGSGGLYDFSGYISNFRIIKGQALYTSNFTLTDIPNPPVRSLPTRYAPPSSNYAYTALQVNPSEIVNLDYSSNWSQISMGDNHAMGIKNDGTLWAWGLNNRGQLGDPLAGGQIPVQNQYGFKWKQVSCGGTNSAMIRTDGTLWTCGYGTYGQNGDGTSSNRSSPVSVLAGGTNWKSVSVGGLYVQEGHMAAIKTDGTLWTWGANNAGQLGDGTTLNKSSPVKVVSGNINNWKSVSAGYKHTAGIAQD